METLTDTTLENQEEIIDGKSYTKCVFNNCTLVYKGGPFPAFDSCQLNNCSWVFQDAADRTVNFMRAIYHGMGEGGQELIEQTFENIRRPQ
jgi:hypothetical protein